MLCLGTTAHAQRSSAPPPVPPDPTAHGNPTNIDNALGEDSRDRLSHLQIEQEKARNDERQKKLVADTEKLLSLATELKTYVGKTNKDVMSVDVIRKADEIEKLAHSVKEKMKGT